MMKKYDAVIIGAGPAGGQCARELSQAGFKILLIDKAKSLLENNYSSGGAPLNVLSDFDLPESTVGTYWNTLRIHSTNASADWTSQEPFGPVFDFDKLKAFLIEETVRHGGKFQLGCQYQNHQVYSHSIEVYLKDLESSSIYPIQTAVLIDATGSERKVLSRQNYDKNQAIMATGIEYHLDVNDEIYQKYSHSLNFFLGHHWMPQGYAWIFPMAPSTLKVGVIRYFQNKSYIAYEPSYKPYLEKLLNLCGPHELKDKHGKTIYYTEKQKDLRYRGPVIAIGDAVSSINPLGWEGIRHAMYTGRFAASALQSYLKGEVRDLSDYDKMLHQYFGRKWIFSEKMINRIFKTKNDALIDRSVHSFTTINNQDMMKMLFDYQFPYRVRPFFNLFWNLFFCKKS